MTFQDITPDLKAAMPELRGRLLANQSLAPLTWFRVGGPAQILFTPADEDDLVYFLSRLASDIPVAMIGVGSNLIVRDGGVEGVVIRLSPRGFGATVVNGDSVTAGTAALDKRVAEAAAAANISGLEFYFGIPGTIGGALRMNAGANGGETKDVLVAATGIGRDGTKYTFDNAAMAFVYRNSGVDPQVIFTSATFRGSIAEPSAIRARMDEVQAHRETAQPTRAPIRWCCARRRRRAPTWPSRSFPSWTCRPRRTTSPTPLKTTARPSRIWASRAWSSQ